jgi:hypothetical protein
MEFLMVAKMALLVPQEDSGFVLALVEVELQLMALEIEILLVAFLVVQEVTRYIHFRSDFLLEFVVHHLGMGVGHLGMGVVGHLGMGVDLQ